MVYCGQHEMSRSHLQVADDSGPPAVTFFLPFLVTATTT